MKLVVAFLALLCVEVRAAHYFVDYAGGNDSNNGTSTNTPWKRFPGASGATGVPGSITSLSPGDTITFKAGVTNIGIAGLRGNGTADNPIIYRVATNWGTGNYAYFENNFTPQTSAFVSGTTPRSYNQFQGLVFRRFGGYTYDDPVFSQPMHTITTAIGGAREGNGFYFRALITGFKFIDCHFYELGHWTNVIQNTSDNCVKGHGIAFESGAISNMIISCTASNVSNPFKFSALSGKPVIGNIVTNCELRGAFRWGLTWQANEAGVQIWTNHVVDTVIHDYEEYDQVNWKADPDNDGDPDSPHTNGGAHFQHQNMNVDWGDGGVRYNRCRFYYDTPRDGGGTSMLFASRNASIWVDNCLFLAIKQPIYIVMTHYNFPSEGYTQNIRIRNNIFVGGPTFMRIRHYSNEADPYKEYTKTNKNVWVSGNIFIKSASTHRVLLLEQATNMLRQLDGNLYWNTATSQAGWTHAAQIVGGNKTFSQLQAMGYEQNGVYGDPKLTNLFASPWRTALPYPLEGSAAIGAGLNLTNINPLDFFGVSRVGKPLTIGPALQYEAGEVDPGDTTPPTPNPLTWTVTPRVLSSSQQSATITMSWSPATDDSGDPVIYTVTEHTGNPGCSGTTSTTATTFEDAGVGFNTECIYSVTARDSAGNSTDPSTQESVVTPASPPPVMFVATNVTASLVALAPPNPLLLFFDAESGTTPEGFTNTGSINWADSFASYQGVYALAADTDTNRTQTSRKFSSQNSITMYGAVRLSAISSNHRLVVFAGENGNNTAGFGISTTNVLFWHGNVTNNIPGSYQNARYYNYRFALSKGSGSDGYAHLTVHTNWTFSGSSLTGQISNGTGTTPYNQVFYGHVGSATMGTIRYDQTWVRSGIDVTTDDPQP